MTKCMHILIEAIQTIIMQCAVICDILEIICYTINIVQSHNIKLTGKR